MIDVLESSDADLDARRSQYRGSDDAVTWSTWMPLGDARATYPWRAFIQVRVLVEGEWVFSPIFTWD